MKKSILLSAMCMLFIIGLTSMIKMDPPPNTECKEICSYFENFGLSHGDCMSTCATCTNPGKGKGVNAVCICNIIDDGAGVKEFGFKNFGHCVKAFKKEFGN